MRLVNIIAPLTIVITTSGHLGFLKINMHYYYYDFAFKK